MVAEHAAHLVMIVSYKADQCRKALTKSGFCRSFKFVEFYPASLLVRYGLAISVIRF